MLQFIIFVIFCFGSIVCTDTNSYTRVKSEYSYLVPDSYDFNKKEFLKDGPHAPFDKAIMVDRSDYNKYYQCQSMVRNGTAAYCKTWVYQGKSGTNSSSESEGDVCNCLENSMGPNYCTYWFCTQQKTEVAVTTCVCRHESLNVKYCQQWWCLETSKDGNTAVQEYNCNEPQPKGGEFCLSWSGRSVSDDKKKWMRCRCNRVQEDHCDYWTCYEKERQRSYLNNFIFLMILSGLYLLNLPVWFLLARRNPDAASCCRQPRGYIMVIVFGCVLSGVCLLAGGVVGLFVGAIWTIIATILVCITNRNLNSNENQSRGNQYSNYNQTDNGSILTFFRGAPKQSEISPVNGVPIISITQVEGMK